MGFIESLVPATPEAQAAFEAAQAKPAGLRLLLTCAADVVPEAIVWLWPGWLPAGKISILAGSPGTGKTTLALAMAAIVTMGDMWPDGSRMKKPGRVLIWSSEDDPADTLVPRLMAAGADLRRIHFAQAVADEHGELQPFDPARDMHLLSERLSEMGGADLLIVDPIVSAVSGGAHRVNDVRRNLQDLVNVAAAHRCAVLGVSHFAKGTRGTSPAERVIGSQAFVALARMVLVAGKDEAAERRILARAKSNISPDDGGVSYSIEQVEAGTGITASRIVWGDLIEGTAREILGAVEQEDDQEERTERDEAVDFLRSLLEAGPTSVKAIKADSAGAGYAWRTIERAKRELGVEAHKAGMKEGWVWALPAEVRHEDGEPRHSLNGGGLRESWRSSGITRVCGEAKTASFAEDREDRHRTGSGGVRAQDAEINPSGPVDNTAPVVDGDGVGGEL
ncbi:AAA family ATPase [Ralstonia solanacearum]|uniref:AAA family ATPase n=1 Tax=Ralstonia solanacearum TaxID=305 RepID=UPI0009B8378A|nr:AAA family ATPase [Ralstonia solanacearum]